MTDHAQDGRYLFVEKRRQGEGEPLAGKALSGDDSDELSHRRRAALQIRRLLMRADDDEGVLRGAQAEDDRDREDVSRRQQPTLTPEDVAHGRRYQPG